MDIVLAMICTIPGEHNIRIMAAPRYDTTCKLIETLIRLDTNRANALSTLASSAGSRGSNPAPCHLVDSRRPGPGVLFSDSHIQRRSRPPISGTLQSTAFAQGTYFGTRRIVCRVGRGVGGSGEKEVIDFLCHTPREQYGNLVSFDTPISPL